MHFPQKKHDEKRLLELYRGLTEEQRATVLAFLEFLDSRNPKEELAIVATPLEIPRPAQESVVKALKRLRETYPMLDPSKLLHEASGHMQQHLLQGKPADKVIDELEALFARHYEKHKSGSD